MIVIKYRKIWYIVSTLVLAGSFWAMYQYGFRLSVDFKGGTLTEVKYTEVRPMQAELESKITALDIGGFSVRPSGDTNYIIRTKELSAKERELLLGALGHGVSKLEIERQNTIGPVVGAELQNKAFKAIIVVVLMIVLFITFAFRKVSRPVQSWKYGLATIVALAHDVIIPTGIFVFLGHLYGFEIDLLFITGLLAILGYSVHDTIVVFDRVRENLRINEDKEFEVTVGKSVNQTFARSINTSVTIFIMLLALPQISHFFSLSVSLLVHTHLSSSLLLSL